MKNQVKVLIESIIEEKLQEMVITPETAANENLALLQNGDDIRKTFVLYKLEESLEIYGMIQIVKNTECDAYEVVLVAAEKGYGPLMYQAAMSIDGPKYLMADRQLSSAQARNVWKKFYDRQDIEKEILNDKCQYKETENPSLQYKYKLKNLLTYSNLLKKNEENLKKWKLYARSKEQLLDKILEFGNYFFMKNYY